MHTALARTTEARSSLLAPRGVAVGAPRSDGIVTGDTGTGAPMKEWIPDGLSLAEGGKWGGLVVIMLALGRGIAYLLNWQGARDEQRAARAKEWEESLQRRETEYRERVEKDIRALHQDVAALRGTVARVCNAGSGLALELHRHDPDSEALNRWQRVLNDAFPTEPVLPADMSELVLRLNRQANSKERDA